MGVESFRGPNGTGSVRPSFSDLICSGGVIAADRFQFLTWTVVGIALFLLVVVRSDPSTVSSLPNLPDGFLYMSGISAFGYLGGKLARKAGPVIDAAIIESSGEPPLAIAVTGRSLSPSLPACRGSTSRPISMSSDTPTDV